MTSVYLAGRYSRRAELLERAMELRAAGLQVTSRWLVSEGPEPTDAVSAAVPARADLADIARSDVLVLVTEQPGVPGASRDGRFVEAGCALGLGLPVLVVGPPENLFCWDGAIEGVRQVDDWDAALGWLRRFARRFDPHAVAV